MAYSLQSLTVRSPLAVDYMQSLSFQEIGVVHQGVML